MKFTESELVFIKVIMEETYRDYADTRNIELKNKWNKEAEITKRYMNIIENIIEKVREELGI